MRVLPPLHSFCWFHCALLLSELSGFLVPWVLGLGSGPLTILNPQAFPLHLHRTGGVPLTRKVPRAPSPVLPQSSCCCLSLGQEIQLFRLPPPIQRKQELQKHLDIFPASARVTSTLAVSISPEGNSGPSSVLNLILSHADKCLTRNHLYK